MATKPTDLQKQVKAVTDAAKAETQAKAQEVQHNTMSAKQTKHTKTNDAASKRRRNKAFWTKDNTVVLAIANSNEFMAVTRHSHKLSDLYKTLEMIHGQGTLFTMQTLRAEQVTNEQGNKRNIVARYNANYAVFIATSETPNSDGHYPTYFYTLSGRLFSQTSRGSLEKCELASYWVQRAMTIALQTGTFNGRKFLQKDSPIVMQVDTDSDSPTFYAPFIMNK